MCVERRRCVAGVLCSSVCKQEPVVRLWRSSTWTTRAPALCPCPHPAALQFSGAQDPEGPLLLRVENIAALQVLQRTLLPYTNTGNLDAASFMYVLWNMDVHMSECVYVFVMYLPCSTIPAYQITQKKIQKYTFYLYFVGLEIQLIKEPIYSVTLAILLNKNGSMWALRHLPELWVGCVLGEVLLKRPSLKAGPL